MIDDDDGDDNDDGMVPAAGAQRHIYIREDIHAEVDTHIVLRFIGTCTHYKLVYIGTFMHIHITI